MQVNPVGRKRLMLLEALESRELLSATVAFEFRSAPDAAPRSLESEVRTFQAPTNVPAWVLRAPAPASDSPQNAPPPSSGGPDRVPTISVPVFNPVTLSPQVNIVTVPVTPAPSPLATPTATVERSATVTTGSTAQEISENLAGPWTFPTALEGFAGDAVGREAAGLPGPEAVEPQPDQQASRTNATPAAGPTQGADLLPGMVAIDTTLLDRAMQQLVMQVGEVGTDLSQFLGQRGLTPWVLAAAVVAGAGEIGRRRKARSRRLGKFGRAGALANDPSTWMSGLPGTLGTDVL